MTNYDDADVFETTRCFSGPGQSGAPLPLFLRLGVALLLAPGFSKHIVDAFMMVWPVFVCPDHDRMQQTS